MAPSSNPMKHIYLDQNKWIDLAKAALGRPDGKQHQPPFEALVKGVRESRDVLPITSQNIIELAKSPRQDQRDALAGLMRG